MAKNIKPTKYRCVHCGKIILRNSNKAWVESYCDKKDRMVHLQRVKR